ncbi:MAG TPA: TIGR04222 domain-containing membrane protein [Polyangiaceae bacterium]|nr:TIGR04222 domain-containing membrane protein [Polyangiaceae bacterium]
MHPETERKIANILAHEFDEPGVTIPFTKRLARENGWTESYSARVINEYKRFLALAVAGDPMVSPSDAVDQAWHLHLQYSARYRKFCQNVLQQNLDHRPSEGGEAELSRYKLAYGQTLERYEELFGEPPPADIWPAPSERFRQEHAVRVTIDDHWVIAKAQFVHRTLLVLVAAIALIASLSTSISGATYLYGYVTLWFACLIAAFVARRVADGPEPEPYPTLDHYELLQLASGPLGAVDGAVARLIAEQAIEFEPSLQRLKLRGPLPATATDLERRVYEKIPEESSGISVRELRRTARELTPFTTRRLKELGLITERHFDNAFWLALVAPAFALIRIVSRLGTDKPIGFLLLLFAVGLFVAFRTSRRSGRTRWGDQLLARARAEHPNQPAVAPTSSTQIPLSLALFGATAVTVPIAASWLDWVSSKRYTASTSSGACASGCGGDGSGCGGGDGGGGCGGGDGGGCGGGCGGCGGGGD